MSLVSSPCAGAWKGHRQDLTDVEDLSDACQFFEETARVCIEMVSRTRAIPETEFSNHAVFVLSFTLPKRPIELN
jgi:hypothetical protein